MGFEMMYVSESSGSLLRIYSFFVLFFSCEGSNELSKIGLQSQPAFSCAAVPVLLSPAHSLVAQHFKHSSV